METSVKPPFKATFYKVTRTIVEDRGFPHGGIVRRREVKTNTIRTERDVLTGDAVQNLIKEIQKESPWYELTLGMKIHGCLRMTVSAIKLVSNENSDYFVLIEKNF